jgi:hypothetical protein
VRCVFYVLSAAYLVVDLFDETSLLDDGARIVCATDRNALFFNYYFFDGNSLALHDAISRRAGIEDFLYLVIVTTY